MNQAQWDNLSLSERYDYLTQGRIEIDKQFGIPATAKVGDTTTVARYAIKCNGVHMSNWCETLEDALYETSVNLKAYKTEE